MYLKVKNIKSTRPSKKLDLKYYGPYEVEMPVGKQAYHLRLPKGFRKVHNVFHVSLLEPCDNEREAQAEPPPIEVNGEELWELQEILNSRLHYGKLQYLFRWLGFSEADDQWLSVDGLEAAQDSLPTSIDSIQINQGNLRANGEGIGSSEGKHALFPTFSHGVFNEGFFEPCLR